MKLFARINWKALRRLILVASLALAATGCDDAKEKAESFGIIGGVDGPTAVWLTTPLSSSNGEPVIILRGTKGTRNCVFDDNGVAVPNTAERLKWESKFADWILDDKVWWLDPAPKVFKTMTVNPCASPSVAARVAEQIFVDIYGKKVLSERPWRVTDTNGCYFICGTLPKGFVGGVAQLKLKKADGMVWVYLHGK